MKVRVVLHETLDQYLISGKEGNPSMGCGGMQLWKNFNQENPKF